MKKRIWISVVLAVLLLEVGFGVSVAVERKYESALNSINLPIDSVKEVQSDADREPEIASLLPVEDFVADTHVVVTPTAKKLRDLPVSATKASKKLISTPIAEKRPSKSTARPEPNKQTIAIKTAEIPEIPAADLNIQKEAPRTDNKSFLAKTQTILKKPFGWIKAIGSKLR